MRGPRGEGGGGRCAALLCLTALALPGRGSAQEASEARAPVAGAAEIAARLDRLLKDPALVRAHVGLAVQVAETGEVLYEREAEKRFVPASNTKIVTAAVGLARLGPGFRWKTRLLAGGPIRGGTLAGDLWIVGSGDPQLTREEVRRWGALLAEAGIRRVTGDVIGDDRAFDPPQWSEGWMWDDLYGGWSAGVSGLQLSPNTVRGYVVPGPELGAPSTFGLRARGPALPIAPRVRTGAPGSEVDLRFVPPPEGGDVELTGWVPLGGDTVSLFLATPHPTLYLLDYLRMALADSGIAVDGRFRRAAPEETPPAPTWTAELRSDSLGAVIAELLKPSDNQMAESLLRTLGREVGDGGSAGAGLEVVEETLGEWGIEPGAVALTDGSGLSRYNQVTPNALNRLLRVMWRHPHHDVFAAAMPIAGVDGTLRQRLIGTAAVRNVQAKTGSLRSVRALSGYLTDGDGETIIFSLILNGYDSPGDVAVALEDLLVEQLSLYHRKTEPGWPAFRGGGEREVGGDR